MMFSIEQIVFCTSFRLCAFQKFQRAFAEAFVILRTCRNHNDAIKRTRIPRLDRTHVSRIMMPLRWHRRRWRIGCHPRRLSTMGCILYTCSFYSRSSIISRTIDATRGAKIGISPFVAREKEGSEAFGGRWWKKWKKTAGSYFEVLISDGMWAPRDIWVAFNGTIYFVSPFRFSI